MDETRDERGPDRQAAETVLAPGQRVGRYRLERELGIGGMGVVWLASDPALARQVAVKFLRVPAGAARGSSHAEERFLREARAMAQLSHANVVGVFDIGTADDIAFFAMEYVEGTTLQRWLTAGEPGWREVVELFVLAGSGLAAAHAAGLVHRDFKPANVLVGDDRRVKVADFGIARAIADPALPTPEPPTPAALALTNPGTVAGTPGYMAPEVLAGELAGPAADQFAFAVSLREALARAVDAPPTLAQVVSRGLAAAPAERYASVAVMLGELQRILTPDSARELTFGFPPSDPVSEKRRYTAELAKYFGDRFGVVMRASFAADYRGLVDDLVAGRLDAAWLAPLSLIRAERQVRPLLVIQRAGRGSYHGALVARRDSGLVGLRDLAGKRVGWVDEDSAAGYVLARALIAEWHRDVDAFLGPQRILGSHRAVVEAVLNGWVDVGATFMNYDGAGNVVFSGWQEFLGERANELGPIAVTGSIPGDVIAVRGNFPREDTAMLVRALRDLVTDPAGRQLFAKVFNGGDGVEDPRPDEHAGLAKLAQRAGWRP